MNTVKKKPNIKLSGIGKNTNLTEAFIQNMVKKYINNKK